jgi:excisionase family DNA binding protein
MKKKEFLSAGEAARILGVSVKTIQRWDKAGLLPVVRTATNQRRIPLSAIHRVLHAPGTSLRCAIYARVSSAKQELEGNLTRQVDRLQSVATARGYQVVVLIQEQASGLNEKRKGLKKLFHLVDEQEIDVVLIEYPDRLVRFGYGYFVELFSWKQVRIEVVEPPKTQTPSEELVQDLLRIVSVFSGRLSGSRAKKIRSCVSQARKRLFESRSSRWDRPPEPRNSCLISPHEVRGEPIQANESISPQHRESSMPPAASTWRFFWLIPTNLLSELRSFPKRPAKCARA